jgi:hypothetical protein
MKSEFEKELSKQGFTFNSITYDHYILSSKDDPAKTTAVRFNCSEPVDYVKYDSHNDNEVEAIGVFRFNFDENTRNSDFLIFVFCDSMNISQYYVIIPVKEFIHRLDKEESSIHTNHGYFVVYWLMPDGCLYDCTDISVEGEWFFLSKGINGRMVDGSIWDYTEYLYAWNKLKRI